MLAFLARGLKTRVNPFRSQRRQKRFDRHFARSLQIKATAGIRSATSDIRQNKRRVMAVVGLVKRKRKQALALKVREERRRLALAVPSLKLLNSKNSPPFKALKDALKRGAWRNRPALTKDEICKRRRVRREVLFAKHKSKGKGIKKHRKPTYDYKSLVKCD